MGGRKAGSTAREVELKLEAQAESFDGLLAHPALAGAERRTERLRAVYFDTPDHRLRAEGISFRVREEGGRRVQTVKAARGAGLAHERSEWETEVTGEGPDLDAAAGTALGPLLADGEVRGAIRPLFGVEVEREVAVLEATGIEAAFDRGLVRAGEREEPFAEVELELKGGRAADLYGLALSLSEAAPLRLGSPAKSERGYRLALLERPRASKAAAVAVAPGLTSGEAFQAIARACLRHFLANEAVLRGAGPDATAVHQARVALRRLRAAVTLFRKVLDDDRRDEVRAELRWMASALGPLRDLDVQIAAVLEPARAAHPGDPGFAALLDAAEARREAARGEVREAVGSPRFAHGALLAAAWTEAGPWTTARAMREARERPAARLARKELARRLKRVRRGGRPLEALDPHARHALRIEVKKLRYAAEFFAELFEGRGVKKRRRALLDALERLQERLGELNDIAVAEAAPREPGPAGEAAARLAAEQAARVEGLLAEARAALDDVTATEPFWEGRVA